MSSFHRSARFLVLCFICSLAATFCADRLHAQNVGRAFFVDITGVPDEYKPYFQEVIDDLNTRIQDYSNELPLPLLREVDQLFLVASVAPAPAGVLGFAGPRGTISYSTGSIPGFNQRSITIPVTGALTINSNEIEQMIIDKQLVPTIAHEILHAFGFGSLWTQNNLISQVDPFGRVTQYTGGKYALREFRKEANLPLSPFIPLQQAGGAGSALSHWDDFHPFFGQTFTPQFRKEVMSAFACDQHPNDPDFFVCPPVFFSRTTEGAMADLGYAMFNINPNRTPRPSNVSYKNWPQIVVSGASPFNRESDLSFRVVNINKVFKRNKNVAGGINQEGQAKDPNDPFKLKDQKWAK